MLETLRGEVISVGEDAAVLQVGPVGVRVQMPTGDLAKITGQVTLHAVLQVKDENISLYGFASESTRDLYRALTTVSGVGPKVALAVLSAFTPEALARAITAGDAGALESVSGVGKRTAGRIVLDLKDKLGVAAEVGAGAGGSSALGEVREALKGLGYSPQEIQPALGTLPPDGDVPTLLRHALRSLGGGDVVEPSGNGSPRKGRSKGAKA